MAPLLHIGDRIPVRVASLSPDILRVSMAEVVAVDEHTATIEPVPEPRTRDGVTVEEVAFIGPLTIPRTATHWPPSERFTWRSWWW